MKTKIISKLKKEILVIEFPEGYELAGVTNDAIYYYDNQMNYEDYPLSILVEGSYTLLGTPDEIKEEYVEDLVEIFDLSFYVDYNHPNPRAYTFTALESFNSALEKEIYWNNPFENPDKNKGKYTDRFGDVYLGKYEEDFKQWNEAQEKTFDKARTLIFVKN